MRKYLIKLLGIKTPQAIHTFTVSIGTVNYSATSTSLEQCTEEIVKFHERIKPEPIDYIG